MNKSQGHKLYFGPYRPPKVIAGARLMDVIRGSIIVDCYSDGRIPWPCQDRWRSCSPILCGDLVKAVKRESKAAIMYWWGVSEQLVWRWRHGLGVGPDTEGTRRLRSFRGGQPSILANLAKGRRVMEDPLFRAKLTRRRLRQRWVSPEKRIWTPKENALLGTMPDQAVAGRIKCSQTAVSAQRRRLGMPAYRKRRPDWGTLAVSARKILAKRLALRLNRIVVARRSGIPHLGNLERGVQRYLPPDSARRLAKVLKCSIDDLVLRAAPVGRAVPDSLLGTMMDTTLAQRYRVCGESVRERRGALGIPAYRRPPFPDESLLGTMPDVKLATLWGMPAGRVAHRRRALGISSFHKSRQWRLNKGKLRACRLATGLTWPQVAARAHMSIGHYRQMESGVCRTSLPGTVKRIATVLRCSAKNFAMAPASL